jgi:CubicO group peptidase (beta-lactamase class C family)
MSLNQFWITRNLFIFLSVYICICPVEPGLTAQFMWKTTQPESQGFFVEKLNNLKESLAVKNTKALLIIRSDAIVCEWYAKNHGPTKKHYTASLAKALVGGMSLLTALNDGLITIDEPACNYIPQWKTHPVKSRITIRHLATHSSGVEDAEQDNIPHMKLPGWKGGFWRKEPDPFTLSRDKAPIIFTPGSKYAYSNPGMAILSYTITSSLKGTKYTDVRNFLRERIMRPIGVDDNEWSIGYGKTYKVNGLNLVANWGGGSYTARAVARVGRLMLRKGNWQGKQLIQSKWVETVLKYAETPLPDRPPGNPQPASGLCWYTNFDGVWLNVPRDAFAGAGAGNQLLLVVPSLDLIVVRNGGNLYDSSRDEGFWGGLEKYLFTPLMKAIVKPGRTSSATENLPADPKGEFLTAVQAKSVNRLFGLRGVNTTKWPHPDKPIGQSIGYHLRSGKHAITAYDWEQFIRFVDRYL